MHNLEGSAISKERSSKGKSFHAGGPTSEEVLAAEGSNRRAVTERSFAPEWLMV